MSEPIKHHFVPQFIIRNFLVDTSVWYWNIEKNIIEKRNPKSILMKKNLYKDENNHADDIMAVEKKFSIFEEEISKLINQKLLLEDKIILTRKENERLRKFLFLLSFRSANRKKQYINCDFSKSTQQILRKYVKDNDYVDLWLRELNAILECNTIDEIEKNEVLTPIIKQDIKNEIDSYYMTIVESRGQDFVLTDIYPTTEVLPLNFENANFHMHQMFPISPNRCILLNSIIWKKHVSKDHPFYQPMNQLSKIKGKLLTEPKAEYIEYGKFSSEDRFIFTVVKAYKEDVQYINHLLLNEAREGVVFNKSERIIDSIFSFSQLDVETKATLDCFLAALESKLN